MLQTVDFIPPVVDDPFVFGRIAAANALSDVYAMGGRPLTALNIAAFPAQQLGIERMRRILEGASAACIEAGVAIVGGHTVNDPELKFGLSVTGRVQRDQLVTNQGALAGDELILTKALGTGILFNAFRGQRLDVSHIESWQASMSTLNQLAAGLMVQFGVKAATDVTGFGLFGHLHQMMKASKTCAHLKLASIPILPGVEQHNVAWSGGSRRNLDYVGDFVDGADEVSQRLLADPQTSGGLLMAVHPSQSGSLLNGLQEAGHHDAARIGRVVDCKGEEGPAGAIKDLT